MVAYNYEEELIMHILMCKLIKDGWLFDNRDIAESLCEGTYNILKEPYCHVCAMPSIETDKCSFHRDLYGFSRIYVMGVYYPRRLKTVDLLSNHILELKKDKRYAKPLGVALSIIIKRKYPEVCNADLLTAVPMSTEEYAKRGFNQALELANVIGRELNIKVEHVLYKTSNIKMKYKKYEERKRLVRGLYQILHKVHRYYLYGKHILLVDDIVTSGFTVSECSKVLKDAGAKRVDVIALARTALGGYKYA